MPKQDIAEHVEPFLEAATVPPKIGNGCSAELVTEHEIDDFAAKASGIESTCVGDGSAQGVRAARLGPRS